MANKTIAQLYVDHPVAAPLGTSLIPISEAGSTGAFQVRNLAQGLGYFSVKDYGALGNDSANDTAAVQAAIEAAKVAGGVVFFPPGTYKCNTLTIYSNTLLMGCGAQVSVIKSRAAETLLTFTLAVGVFSLLTGLDNLGLDGNSVGTIGLNLTGAFWTNLHNLYIKRFTTAGIYARGSLTNLMTNSVIESCAIGIDADQGNTILANPTAPNFWSFLQVRFNNCTTYAVKWDHGGQITFDGCDFEILGTAANAATGGIKFNGTYSPGLTMRNCWFEVIYGGAIVDLSAATGRHSFHSVYMSGAIGATYGIKGAANNIISIENCYMTGAVGGDIYDASSCVWHVKDSYIGADGTIGPAVNLPQTAYPMRYDYAQAEGIILPSLSTTARDALASPTQGMLLFNTTTSQLNFYNGSWSAIAWVLSGLITSLVSYWRMDGLDPIGGKMLDIISTSANDLTDNNTIGSAAGKISNAALFVRANSESLSHADNASLSTGDIDFTWCAWVYMVTKPAADMAVLSHFDSPGFGYELQYDNAADRFNFFVGDGVSTVIGTINATTLGSPTTATWYFIVAWHNATANTVSIQVNNGTADSAATTGAAGDSPGTFRIGARGSGSNYWDGRIDEVGFWKRTLTAGERTSLYNAGAGLSWPF